MAETTETVYKGKTYAVILAAGTGERVGLGYNKLLYRVGQKTVLELTLDKFIDADIDGIVIAAARTDFEPIQSICKNSPIPIRITEGGATRAESVYNALLHLKDLADTQSVVIHDGARPFVTPELINKCIASAKKYGSGVAAVKTVDTVRVISASGATAELDRNELYNIQTPQAFDFDTAFTAYTRHFSGTSDSAFSPTDDAGMVAHYIPNTEIRYVEGSYDNIKITSQEDLFKLPHGCRMGLGQDLHRLDVGRRLVLGGVVVPFNKGLVGHSDADVLTHAVIDALLSAADLPDIGTLYPDTDAEYKDISSVKLLKDVAERIRERGYTVRNISAVITAERPRLSGFTASMRNNIATALGTLPNNIGISVKTCEKLGDIGAGNAMAATAVCMLVRGNDD